MEFGRRDVAGDHPRFGALPTREEMEQLRLEELPREKRRKDAQLVANRLRDKLRKAKQRDKKKARQQREKKEASLRAPSAPWVESIWSRRGPLDRRHSLLVKITSDEETSDEETMLAVATSIWRWDRATGWEKVKVDIPGDEETMAKPDLSTKEGRSKYNRTNYNKRKAAGKVAGETETKRPYNRTSFPKREKKEASLRAPSAPSVESIWSRRGPRRRHDLRVNITSDEETSDEETMLAVATSPNTQGFKRKTAEMTPGETKKPYNRSCFPKRLDERVDYSTLPSVVTWFPVSRRACAVEMELCTELDTPLAAYEDKNEEDISLTVSLAVSEDKNEEDIALTVPLAASEDQTEETPLAVSEDKHEEDAPSQVGVKWLDTCSKERVVKWLEFCKEVDAKAAKTVIVGI
jgi:hypothetical protein